MKKYNIKDNFEDVYLRSKMAQRHLKNADPNLHKDPEFKKTINYISHFYYKKHMGVYQMAGFDFDDIHNIALMFGLIFSGYGQKFETTKDFYTIMMRFISQRMFQMAGWVIKKFQLNELAPKQIQSFDPLTDNNLLAPRSNSAGTSFKLHNNIVIDGVYMYESGPIPDEEQIRRTENTIDILEAQYSVVNGNPRNTSDREQSKRTKRKIKRKLKTAEKTLAESQKKKREIRKKQKEKYEILKQELHENWHKHIDELAYYSVSRFVSSGVRKSARTICKKYNIDYEEWAQKQIEERKLDSGDIIIG